VAVHQRERFGTAGKEAMRRILTTRALAPAALLAGAAVAWAQDAPAPSASTASAPPLPMHLSEGAIGLQGSYGPAYLGGSDREVSVRPGFYLRWGRISIATAGGFVNRDAEEVVRGLGAELVRARTVKLQLGLRYDTGRKSSASAQLAGLDDVRSTLRARIALTWLPSPGWRTGVAWSSDILHRGGGGTVELALGHDFRWSPRTTWSISGGTTWADERYMRSRFGVTDAEAARTSYAAYRPGAGPLSVALRTDWRTDYNPRWTWWWGVSASRLLGPAADSPLTTSTTQANLNGGFAWRF
jgi:outer membrane scaffolding protein for murein synthesis (MipA/OmpV family)